MFYIRFQLCYSLVESYAVKSDREYVPGSIRHARRTVFRRPHFCSQYRKIIILAHPSSFSLLFDKLKNEKTKFDIPAKSLDWERLIVCRDL